MGTNFRVQGYMAGRQKDCTGAMIVSTNVTGGAEAYTDKKTGVKYPGTPKNKRNKPGAVFKKGKDGILRKLQYLADEPSEGEDQDKFWWAGMDALKDKEYIQFGQQIHTCEQNKQPKGYPEINGNGCKHQPREIHTTDDAGRVVIIPHGRYGR